MIKGNALLGERFDLRRSTQCRAIETQIVHGVVFREDPNDVGTLLGL